MCQNQDSKAEVFKIRFTKLAICKTDILIIYLLNSDTGKQVSGDIWDDIGYMGHAHMPRRYHTGLGGYPNPSDEPERQHENILRHIRVGTYTQAAESGLCTLSFYSLILFRFRWKITQFICWQKTEKYLKTTSIR